jgi:hypothetical protein
VLRSFFEDIQKQRLLKSLLKSVNIWITKTKKVNKIKS